MRKASCRQVSRRTGGRSGLAIAMAVTAAGGGLALLASAQAWDSVMVSRAAPLAGLTVHVAGRTLEPAVTGLGVVALAGVVALLATRGTARRGIGALIVLAGLLLGWRAVHGFSAVSATRARELVAEARIGTTLGAATDVRVQVQQLWPGLAVVAAVLIVFGGGLVFMHAGRWAVMGTRYDAPAGHAAAPPTAGAQAASVGDLAMWKSLDRGDDPTL